MPNLHVSESPWELPALSPGAIAAVDKPLLEVQAPNAHLQWVNEVLEARCSLWWQGVPAWPGHRLGVIGHFAAADERASSALLDAACARLGAEGCTLGIGPMDGNTWRSYRFVTEPGEQPPFLLEPSNPPDWPQFWTRSGFRAFQGYQSSQLDDFALGDPRLDAVRARLREAGVRWRPLKALDFEGELGRIFEVSEAAFEQAVLYTPLPKAEFLAMYQKVRPYVREELVWIAEQGHRPVGFVFAVPDLAQAQRGEPVDTVIIKTLAILPDRALAGLGKVLLEQAHAAARNLGMQHVIHALMHDGNRSTLMGAGARVIRRYTLLAKDLA